MSESEWPVFCEISALNQEVGFWERGGGEGERKRRKKEKD